jgi:hypothetical protein
MEEARREGRPIGTPYDPGTMAEKIVKMLFTGSDGTEYEELHQVNEDGAEGMHLGWAYVVQNVRQILQDG